MPTSLNTAHYLLQWKLQKDYPGYGQLSCDRLDHISLEEYESNSEIYEKKYPNFSGIKVGGWPRLIQETYFLMEGDADYVLQIDQTDVYCYCDCGIGYLFKSKDWWTHWDTF